MPIAADILKNAASQFSAPKNPPVEVDLRKMAVSFTSEMSALGGATDPDKAVDAITKKVGDALAMLSSGQEVDGRVFVDGSDIAKSFAPDAPAAPTEKGKGKKEPAKKADCAVGDTVTVNGQSAKVTAVNDDGTCDVEYEDGSTDTVSMSDITMRKAAAAQDGDGTDETKKAIVEDTGQPVEWPRDMSPAITPTLRSERLTKDEQPIAARPGSAAVRKKFDDKRAKAFARKVGDEPQSARCMK